MPRFLPDTSCIVAALCTWHEYHGRAVAEIERRLENSEALVVAAPALVETYAVLTRLPAPYRLSPTDSIALLEANYLSSDVETIGLEPDGYYRLLRSAPEQRVAGGQVYDAVIVACALVGNVDVLLTFNERQFRPLAAQGIEIVVPA
jgi:predicted nucleic acid-binding protein